MSAPLLLLPAVGLAWDIRGPDARPTGHSIAAQQVFVEGGADSGLPLGTDPTALAAVAASALAYIDAMEGLDPAVGAGMLQELGIDAGRVRRTLEVVLRTFEEDRLSPSPRLTDPTWVAAHFDRYTWRATTPDGQRSKKGDSLRISRYIVTRLDGRYAPEGPFNQALYADPGPGQRERFTRAQVVAGAWKDGGATPLVWLTEDGLYDAMMQGTVEVVTPEGAPRLFNVHQHNGIPYDKTVTDSALQRRYWYFREVEQIRGWGQGERFVELQPGAAVAGDIYNLGIGCLLAVDAPTTRRLVVLGDTGGAFQPNLQQLDWLAGTYADRASLYRDTAWLPSSAPVHLLVWREPWER